MRRRFPRLAAAPILALAISLLPAPGFAQVPPAPTETETATATATATAAPEALAPGWARRIDKLVGKRAFSVAVGADGQWLYRNNAATRRAPASNEKLLLSLALMESLGPNHEMPIRASAENALDGDGVLEGPLWIIGSGDPEVGANDIRSLARKLKNNGLTKVQGRVLGATRPFSRDWMAPGWKSYFPSSYVPLPTALSFEGNVHRGRHINDPERRAAQALTKRLRAINVTVTGTPGDGSPPGGLLNLAHVDSAPLEVVMRNMNVPSSNFRAETLGKLLGWAEGGAPGTIKKGAAAIEAFVDDAVGRSVVANDGSGLSYENRVAAQTMVELLWYAEDEPWENDLRLTLPKPGEGTLGSRLSGVTVRAKTGTLTNVSALSGWVWLSETDEWAAFSIISRGPTTAAKNIEDAIVRTLFERAS